VENFPSPFFQFEEKIPREMNILIKACFSHNDSLSAITELIIFNSLRLTNDGWQLNRQTTNAILKREEWNNLF
jgi:hypothetical protein